MHSGRPKITAVEFVSRSQDISQKRLKIALAQAADVKKLEDKVKKFVKFVDKIQKDSKSPRNEYYSKYPKIRQYSPNVVEEQHPKYSHTPEIHPVNYGVLNRKTPTGSRKALAGYEYEFLSGPEHQPRPRPVPAKEATLPIKPNTGTPRAVASVHNKETAQKNQAEMKNRQKARQEPAPKRPTVQPKSKSKDKKIVNSKPSNLPAQGNSSSSTRLKPAHQSQAALKNSSDFHVNPNVGKKPSAKKVEPIDLNPPVAKPVESTVFRHEIEIPLRLNNSKPQVKLKSPASNHLPPTPPKVSPSKPDSEEKVPPKGRSSSPERPKSKEPTTSKKSVSNERNSRSSKRSSERGKPSFLRISPVAHPLRKSEQDTPDRSGSPDSYMQQNKPQSTSNGTSKHSPVFGRPNKTSNHPPARSSPSPSLENSPRDPVRSSNGNLSKRIQDIIHKQALSKNSLNNSIKRDGDILDVRISKIIFSGDDHDHTDHNGHDHHTHGHPHTDHHQQQYRSEAPNINYYE